MPADQPADRGPGQVIVTFDHLGRGRAVGAGDVRRPDPEGPELAVAVPRILRLLDELGIAATFYVEGWSVLHHPEWVHRLIASGHSVGLHGWVHESWTQLSFAEHERILVDGRAALACCGVDEPGFRAPGGYSTADVLPLLWELGFAHDSSQLTPDDPQVLAPHWRGGVVRVPFEWELVDFWAVHRSPRPMSLQQMPQRWLAEVDADIERRGIAVLDLHPFFCAVDDSAWAATVSTLRLIADQPHLRFSSMTQQVTGLGSLGLEKGRAERLAWLGGGDFAPLEGGVSSRVQANATAVVKQPLERLAVAGEWRASTRRVLAEAAAMVRATEIAPKVFDVDAATLTLVQERMPGNLWKQELLDGRFDPATAVEVGRVLAGIHRLDPAGLHPPEGQSELFDQLRLDPYLRVAADQLPQAAGALGDITARLEVTRTHLVHGDFSPKNLLVHRAEAVVVTPIDWEVACAGDPMFDLAFVGCHLLAKGILLDQDGEAAGLFEQLLGGYADDGLDRTWLASLLGAIALGRTDGRSPLEYLDPSRTAQLRARGLALVAQERSWPW